MKLLSIILLLLTSLLITTEARPKTSRIKKPGHSFGNPVRREYAKRAFDNSTCSDAIAMKTVTAPRKNVFAALDTEEAVEVLSFLHAQSWLNLTAWENATSWDNIVLIVETLPPNKSTAAPYLAGEGPEPERWAKATLQFGATLEPYIEEWMVGPLPLVNGSITVQPLNYIYNKGRGYSRIYDVDEDAIYGWIGEIGAQVANITMELCGGVVYDEDNDTLSVWGIDPLWHQDGRVISWYQFWGNPTTDFDTQTVLPTGLYFGADITGRDPAGWSVVGWYYAGLFYNTTEEFIDAFYTPGFQKYSPNVEGTWADTDQRGDIMPYDDLYPSMPIQAEGSRFAVDVEEKYVEWMDFSFYISFSRDTAVKLHDIRYKGERVIYELGLQEALAHYAGQDPVQSGTAYLDSYYGFGPYAYELVNGYDCPTYSVYLNTTFLLDETTHTHVNSICLFEQDAGYPIQRHTSGKYASVTKNIVFHVRSVSTVGNYDYQVETTFHYDGSIHQSVRASGYIQAAFWVNNHDYGFHIHDNLSGSMHDHVLNFKLDLDVNGTANSLMKTEIIPTTETYPWSPIPRNTMKLSKTFITSENDSTLNWAPNNAAMYTVVNKDSKNKFGEYRGWRVAPGTGNLVRLTVQNSTNLHNAALWSGHNLYAVKQHDTEPRSAYPYNSLNVTDPVVDFAKFFNGESLEQEDIVLYFNLGMHHVPDTSDLPNTVFSSAQSSIIIMPQNYFDNGDQSRQTINGVRVSYDDGVVEEVDMFGTQEPSGCELDMSDAFPDLNTYIGDVVIRKFPYSPDEYYDTEGCCVT